MSSYAHRFSKERRNGMNRKRAQGRFVFFCIAPAAILVTLFIFIPTINVFRMSLYRMGGITNRKEFVGLSNFQSLFDDKNFASAPSAEDTCKSLSGQI